MTDTADLTAPGETIADRDAATHGFVMNHTMMRVKDPKASLNFYVGVLGMKLLRTIENDQGKFTLYFVGYADEEPPSDAEALRTYMSRRSGLVELTHNWGTEDQAGPVYHDGNSEPRGFGHIAVTVPDLEGACARFERLGVPFQKRLSDGMMKSLAFIKDPDGYWVEILAKR